MFLKNSIAVLKLISFSLGLLFSCNALSDFFQIEKYPNGLLWRIQKTGIPDSFIFGTIHLTDPLISKLPPKVEEVFDNDIDTLCTEVSFDQPNLQYAASSIYLDKSKSLNTITGDLLYERTASLLERKNISRDISIRLKPWAALIFLIWKNGQYLPLDALLYQSAAQRGFKLCGLQNTRELIKVVDDFPIQWQILMLQDAVDNHAQIPNLLEQMGRFYSSTDLTSLVDITRIGVATQNAKQIIHKEFIDSLFINRNHILVERIQPHLSRGKAFIAISALHLPGYNGVLNLLEQRGYQITRIY